MVGLEMKTPGAAVGAATRAGMDSTEAAILCDHGDQIKARLFARAASAGISIYESFGGYVIGRGVQREIPDLRSLSRCLGAMGVCA